MMCAAYILDGINLYEAQVFDDTEQVQITCRGRGQIHIVQPETSDFLV